MTSRRSHRPDSPRLTRWRAYLAGQGRPAKTIEAYTLAARHLEDHVAAQGRLSADALETFVASMVRGRKAPAGIQLTVIGARAYLAWLGKHGHTLPEFDAPRLPRVPEQLPTIVSPAMMAAFMAQADREPEPLRTALRFLPLAGLRISEVCRLELDDVRVEDIPAPPGRGFVVRVRATDDDAGIEGDKSKKDRDVPIFPDAAPLLKRYLVDVRPSLPHAKAWNDALTSHAVIARRRRISPALFPGLEPRIMQAKIREIRIVIGSSELTAHDFRHDFATRLTRGGFSTKEVGDILGHRSLNTTAKYIHMDNQDTFKRMAGIVTPWAK